jgi:hypothetical protein
MKPEKYEKIIKESEKHLQFAVKQFKRIEKREQEDEERGVGRLVGKPEDMLEYWVGKIEVLTTILGYTKKEINKLLGGKYV